MTDDPAEDSTAAASETDLAVKRTETHTLLYAVIIATVPVRTAVRLECSVVLAHTSQPRQSSCLWFLLCRVVF